MNKITASFWCPRCGYRPTVSKINFLNEEVVIDTVCTMCKKEITYKTTVEEVDVYYPVCGETNTPSNMKLSTDVDGVSTVSGSISCNCGNECTIIFENLELPTNWLPERIIE